MLVSDLKFLFSIFFYLFFSFLFFSFLSVIWRVPFANGLIARSGGISAAFLAGCQRRNRSRGTNTRSSSISSPPTPVLTRTLTKRHPGPAVTLPTQSSPRSVERHAHIHPSPSRDTRPPNITLRRCSPADWPSPGRSLPDRSPPSMQARERSREPVSQKFQSTRTSTKSTPRRMIRRWSVLFGPSHPPPPTPHPPHPLHHSEPQLLTISRTAVMSTPRGRSANSEIPTQTGGTSRAVATSASRFVLLSPSTDAPLY